MTDGLPFKCSNTLSRDENPTKVLHYSAVDSNEILEFLIGQDKNPGTSVCDYNPLI